MGITYSDPDLDTDADILDIADLTPSDGDLLRYDTDGTRYSGIQPSALSVTATSSSTARTLAARFKDTINLKDFGAVCDGSTNDDAAWSAVWAAYPTGGVTIEWQGYCRTNAGITPPSGCSNVTLRPLGFSPLYNPDHGFDFLTLPSTVAGWRLDGLRFLTANGASGGTERFFLNNASNDLITRNMWMRNAWSGFKTTGSKCYFQGRTYVNAIKASSGTAAIIHMGSSEVCELDNIYAENASGQDALAGVWVRSGSAIKVGGTGAKMGNPLRVEPQNGDIIATLALDFNADTSTGVGANFASVGTGVIQRVEGRIRASSNSGTGVYFVVSPKSADLVIRAVDNGGRGVRLGAVDFENARFRVTAFGNGTQGFEAESGATNWTAEVVGGDGDDFGGNGQYTAVVGASCDHFTLDVDGVGDGTALLFNDAGTGATKVVRSRA